MRCACELLKSECGQAYSVTGGERKGNFLRGNCASSTFTRTSILTLSHATVNARVSKVKTLGKACGRTDDLAWVASHIITLFQLKSSAKLRGTVYLC